MLNTYDHLHRERIPGYSMSGSSACKKVEQNDFTVPEPIPTLLSSCSHYFVLCLLPCLSAWSLQQSIFSSLMSTWYWSSWISARWSESDILVGSGCSDISKQYQCRKGFEPVAEIVRRVVFPVRASLRLPAKQVSHVNETPSPQSPGLGFKYVFPWHTVKYSI